MRFIKLVHFLSLDVVAGAVLFQTFLSLILIKDFPNVIEISALGLSVWVIYLSDRMVDNYKMGVQDVLHDFYLKNDKGIKFLILVNLGLLLFISPFLPYRLLFVGILIVVLILFYWFLWFRGIFDHHFGLKEFFTALFYGIGISCFFISYPSVDLMKWLILFLGVFLLAFQNLILFTCIELHRTKDRLLRMIEWTIMCYILFLGYYFGQLVLVLPFLSTFGIHMGLHYFTIQKSARLIGELSFMSPIIYVAYGIFSA